MDERLHGLLARFPDADRLLAASRLLFASLAIIRAVFFCWVAF